MKGYYNILTIKFVNDIKKKGKYFDKNGLFLRVKEGGSKKWVQRYTFSGRRREMGLGNAKVISLFKAKQDAIKNLLLIKKGKDPIEYNKLNKRRTTVNKRYWDKQDWSKSKGEKNYYSPTAFANDDPNAVNGDKYGIVYKKYGTLDLHDLNWTKKEQHLAKRRKPIHQFKKKYYND